MYTTFLVQPIFNVLAAIYAVLPGYNFGLAIIIFTLVVRLAMWPLIKRQLHQARVMRRIQPEVKRIRREEKNRQLQAMQLMELYKRNGVSTGITILTTVFQLLIFIALYSALRRIIDNPQELVDFSYSFLQSVGNIGDIAQDASLFDNTLFGWIDLSRSALGDGGVYWPALLLVIGSAYTQYLTTKQISPNPNVGKPLRELMQEQATINPNDKVALAKNRDEINQKLQGRMFPILAPVLILVISLGFAAALPLYWFVNGLVGYLQQARVLAQDEDEMMDVTPAPEKSTKKSASTTTKKKPAKQKAKKAKTSNNKRRKK